MTPSNLVQYFRSFLIKINMIESVLGQLELAGMYAVKYSKNPVSQAASR